MTGEYKIGFLGGGAMAGAMLAGLLQNGFAPERLYVTDIDENRRRWLAEQFAVHVLPDNASLAAAVDIMIVALKPHLVAGVLAGVAGSLGEGVLVISIAAGVGTQQLEEALGRPLPVVRAMPNTAALVGAAATAVCAGRYAQEQHMEMARQVLAAVGPVVEVPENLMPAVTALSGSGPAYMFLIIEALADAGVAQGLPRPAALQLAAQTMLGAAQLVLKTGQHPAALKDQVTTPAGTTIAALQVLEEGALRGVLGRAVAAAARRCLDLEK
ncbi:MAG: pyrroline-5-carboxylate reductase [Bacillota bacterium]|uniref:pyrroline-5-carboxylate reductase n=1 Tax=Desulfurispora thermophila TaxID=265470 RepID=UPI00047807BF|nr:pyrroline-5-carboxylate reductase [Desulfurispora thermophila]